MLKGLLVAVAILMRFISSKTVDQQVPIVPTESAKLHVAAPAEPSRQTYADLLVDYQPKLDNFTALQYAGWIVENCKRHNLDPIWIIAMMWQESRFLSNSTSSHGALGLMQIMPDTARGLGYTTNQVRDPQGGIEAGVGYLAALKESLGDIQRATTAYNQGPSRVVLGTASGRYYNAVYEHYTSIKDWIKQHG